MAAASIDDTRTAINDALKTHGGVFADYSCKTVSWDDVSRGTVNNTVSCWGANITDTYLKAKDGTKLFTVRPDNWNERLGVVRATDIALLIGNCDPSDSSTPSHPLRNVTLQDFLKSPSEHGAKYSGLNYDVRLDDEKADTKVSIRFQTVFLPVAGQSGNRQTFQFATEAYNYNTTDDEDPRNLIILATTQGLAFQADGAGAKRLLHHARDPSGRVSKYWLEAEQSDHKVGGAQNETSQEREDALQRGKATSEVLGIKAMGTRFNVLMTIQVPLVKKKKTENNPYGLLPLSGMSVESLSMFACEAPKKTFGGGLPVGPLKHKKLCRKSPRSMPRPLPGGSSTAARVSRGECAGVAEPLKVTDPKRNGEEHVTVTVVFYNTVAGGVPKAEDVVAAVKDMESLLDACSEKGRLDDAAFDFMKSKLTVDDMMDISTKISTQPRHVGAPPEKDGQTGGSGANNDEVVKLVNKHIDEMSSNITKENVMSTKMVVLGALASRVTPQELNVAKREFDELLSRIESDGDGDGANSSAVKEKATVVGLAIRGILTMIQD